MPRLVDARGLAGGANEGAREQIGQAGVTLPEMDQAFQQVGTAQERAVGWFDPAHNHVVAAAGAGVASVDHELVRAQTALAGLLIDDFGGVHTFGPVGRGVNVHLKHTGVGGHADHLDARIAGRAVAFDQHLVAGCTCRSFGGSDQLKIILKRFDRRQEHTQTPVARFNRNGGAHGPAQVAIAGHGLFHNLLPCGGIGAVGHGLRAGRDLIGIGQRGAVIHRVLRVDERKAGLGDMPASVAPAAHSPQAWSARVQTPARCGRVLRGLSACCSRG